LDKPPRKEVRKNMKSIKNILKQKKYSVKPQAEPKAKSLDIWNGKRELIINDELFQKAWTAIPNALLADQGVSHGAVRLWSIMYRFADPEGAAWPGQKRLSEILGKSRWQIIRHQKELLKTGWAKLENYKMHKRNVFVLGWPANTKNPKKQSIIRKQMADEKRR